MSEQDTTNTTEAQKTVIAFIAGLLIGGLLVWIFGGTPEDSPTRDAANDVDTSEVEDMDNEVDTDDDMDNDESATEDTADNEGTDTEMETGDGSIEVNDQAASSRVQIESAVFPTDEGWIAVRDYSNGQLGSILGATRYSRAQGLVPQSVGLLRSTTAGSEYAVVFYRESGDREFSVANDVMVADIMSTFTAE